MVQWRFGLDMGRRWRNGKGAAESSTADGNGKNGAGKPGSPGAGSAIIEILDTYDEREDEESRSRESIEEVRIAFRKMAESLIADIIEPTLEAIGDEVLSRGHHWIVEERVDIQSQPAVACLFRPKSVGSGGAASELTFRCLFPDRVSTTAQIHRDGRMLDPPVRSHLATSVGADLVRKEVARFMAQVLAKAPA